MMEMVVIVEQQRNQYCGQTEPHGPARFGSSPSRALRGISCRAFQSGTGILRTPLCSSSSPLTLHDGSLSSNSPKPSLSAAKSPSLDTRQLKTYVKSSPVPINVRVHGNEERLYEKISYSELWAGPAYSNSPPPSSLPIPNFDVRVKQSVSLNLPFPDHFSKIRPIAKSAPTSPTTKEHNPFKRDLFNTADSATKTLRRILNLDDTDE